MNRRSFLKGTCAAVAAVPLAVESAPERMYLLGIDQVFLSDDLTLVVEYVGDEELVIRQGHSWSSDYSVFDDRFWEE